MHDEKAVITGPDGLIERLLSRDNSVVHQGAWHHLPGRDLNVERPDHLRTAKKEAQMNSYPSSSLNVQRSRAVWRRESGRKRCV